MTAEQALWISVISMAIALLTLIFILTDDDRRAEKVKPIRIKKEKRP
ncbi:hypothetical protein IHQ68_04480 [Chelatococcus sambhunathii]|uniref:Uncharacterized protein n=1 Tax=Chelatococcus sambhunathii TaxID=363953 RepID=A0ABU1DCT5_9HYPH|nr:hypothetical protein [Chelatococcus sambhunathii]MDR4305882.1 hypothetical protein [Chelatococcus sambhunathii]